MDPLTLPPSLNQVDMSSSTIQWASGRRWYCDSTFEIHIQYDILAPRLGKVQTVTTWSLPVNVTASLTLFTPSLHPPFTHPPNAEMEQRYLPTDWMFSLITNARLKQQKGIGIRQATPSPWESLVIYLLSLICPSLNTHSLTQHPRLKHQMLLLMLIHIRNGTVHTIDSYTLILPPLQYPLTDAWIHSWPALVLGTI